MKKLATILLVAMLAVSCVFALAACGGEPLADPDYEYQITGVWSRGSHDNWGVSLDENDPTKLDEEFLMEAIAISDKRVKSIKKELVDVKYLYIVEHEFVNEGAGWTQSYVMEKDGEEVTLDGNMCIKVIKTAYEALGDTAAWSEAWLPDAGGTTFRSLTPSTLYMPPHSEGELWPGSGHWNSNPIVLEAGTYYVVFAAFNDGTYGLGAIAK